MQKGIVAVSGGPDSMALLDMLRKSEKYSLFVAHVNYQKRDTAYRDEKIVKDYCEKYSIPYKVLYPVYTSGNFQSWARVVRYDFFKECAMQFGSELVFVAHQMDDCIETYIFQKRRNMACDTFGLSSCTQRNGYQIIRPLLDWQKKDLEKYCIEHSVSYGIDESNLTDHYTRNKIRHSVIEKMSLAEKKSMIEKIRQENNEWNKKRSLANLWDGDMEKDVSWLELEMFIHKRTGKHYSKKYMLSLLEQLHKNILVEIDGYDLENYHGKLICLKQREEVYDIYDAVTLVSKKDYQFKEVGKKIESLTVKETDFPIIVRTVQKKDVIQLRYGKKNVHRFFVDRKISKIERKYWLVVENSKHEVIFVPKIGCDVEHFSIKPNLFMLQCHL